MNIRHILNWVSIKHKKSSEIFKNWNAKPIIWLQAKSALGIEVLAVYPEQRWRVITGWNQQQCVCDKDKPSRTSVVIWPGVGWDSLGLLAQDRLHRNEYFSKFQHRNWHATKTYGESWSGAQQCSDLTTIPSHGTDDSYVEYAKSIVWHLIGKHIKFAGYSSSLNYAITYIYKKDIGL